MKESVIVMDGYKRHLAATAEFRDAGRTWERIQTSRRWWTRIETAELREERATPEFFGAIADVLDKIQNDGIISETIARCRKLRPTLEKLRARATAMLPDGDSERLRAAVALLDKLLKIALATASAETGSDDMLDVGGMDFRASADEVHEFTRSRERARRVESRQKAEEKARDHAKNEPEK